VRIFIVGFKSSGKTTFGRELAKRMQMDFIDLDEKIEEKFGMSIPELYKREGEDSFRKEESRILKELAVTDNIVMSTGGGAACHSGNMSFMEKCGETVYLKADDETLAVRLMKVAHERPVIKGRTREEINDYISEIREKCEHYYMRAKYVLEEKDLSAENLIDQLRKV